MKKAYFNDDLNQTQAVINGTKTQFRQIVPPKALDAWNDKDDGDEYSRSVYAESYEAKMRNFLLKYATYNVGEEVAVAHIGGTSTTRLICENKFNSRGMCYLSIDPDLDYPFEEMCEANGVEYVEPIK